MVDVIWERGFWPICGAQEFGSSVCHTAGSLMTTAGWYELEGP